MDNNTSLADIEIFFAGTVALKDNVPVFIHNIFPDFKYRYKDLLSQEYLFGKDIRKEISPPNRRLGYMNIEGNVVYLKRIPMRIFQIGINHKNTAIDTTYFGNYIINSGDVSQKVKKFNCPELYNCILGIYPSLEEAIELVKDTKDFGGCIAFDRQFAVSCDFKIIYKNKIIAGKVGPKKQIKWNPGHEYLNFLLEKGDEKDFSILAKS